MKNDYGLRDIIFFRPIINLFELISIYNNIYVYEENKLSKYNIEVTAILCCIKNTEVG